MGKGHRGSTSGEHVLMSDQIHAKKMIDILYCGRHWSGY